MKKLLFLLGLLLPLWVNAQQIDSFMVNGNFYKFHIPEDWIIETKQDSVQKSGNWNLILIHAVNTKTQNGRILVAISEIENNTSSEKNKKSKNIKTKEITIAGRKAIQSTYEKPSGDCYDCQKEFAWFYNDIISPNLALTIGSVGDANQILMNEYFRKKLNNFESDFYIRNDSLINTWFNSKVKSLEHIKIHSEEKAISLLAKSEISGSNYLLVVQTKKPDLVLEEKYRFIKMDDLQLKNVNGFSYKYIISKTMLDTGYGYNMVYLIKDNTTRYAPYIIFTFESPIKNEQNVILMDNLIFNIMQNFIKENNIITTN